MSEVVVRSIILPGQGKDEPKNEAEFSAPRAKYGDVVPFIFGTLQQRAPVLIFAGDPTEGVPFEKVDPTDKKQYWSSLDLLLCERIVEAGAEVGFIRLRKIWYDGLLLWDGTKKEFGDEGVRTSNDLLRHDPNGDDTGAIPGGGYVDDAGIDRLGPDGWWGGGISGDLTEIVTVGTLYTKTSDFHGRVIGWHTKEESGVWAQYLGLEKIYFRAGNGNESGDTFLGEKKFGADWLAAPEFYYPNYHRFARLSFNEFCWGEEPTVKPISAEVTVSCPAPAIGDDAGIMPNGLDVNPVSILYTLLTRPEFCLSPRLPGVDTDSFSAARAVIETEGLGASYLLEKAEKAGDLAKTILDHISGKLFLDPSVGLVGLFLKRRVEGELPRFDESHVISLDELSKTTREATYSQARVKFEMRGSVKDGESADNQATAKDPGLAQDTGALETIDRDAPMAYDATVANTIAARTLSEANVPRVRAVLQMNRQLSDEGTGVSSISLRPGDPFVFDYEPHEIEGLVLRTERIDLGTLESNAVTVTAEQDTHQAEAIFAPPPEPDNYTVTQPSDEVAIEHYSVFTAPYLMAKADIVGDARRALTTRVIPQQDDGDDGTVARASNYDRFMALARKPYAQATVFQWTLSASDRVISTKTVPYTPCAILAENIATDEFANSSGLITLSLEDMDPEFEAALPDFDYPANAPAGKTGRGVVMIGDEFFLLGAGEYTPGEDPGTGSVTFVGRRALDSAQELSAHTAGAPVWLLSLDNKAWITERLGPLLESNQVHGRNTSAWLDYLDDLDGVGYGTEITYASGFGGTTWTSAIRNIDPAAFNEETTETLALQDRANNLLPPLRFKMKQTAPTEGSADYDPEITVGETDDSFELEFTTSFDWTSFNPREPDGTYVLPLIERASRVDDGIYRAEFIAEEGTAAARYARLQVWYSFGTPNDGELRLANTTGSGGAATFDCEDMESCDLSIYLRQVFGGDRTEGSDDTGIPMRLSRARGAKLVFTRTEGFDPLDLPESSISWEYLWDLSAGVTLSGSDVDAVASQASPTGHDLGYFVARPPYNAAWRNGQAAFTAASGKALDITNTTPIAAGSTSPPYSVVIVGQFPTLDGSGETYRIPIQGMGSSIYIDAPFYAVRSGTWQLAHTGTATAVSNSDISAWSGLPFIAIVTMAHGSVARVDVHVHGLSPFSATGLAVGTPTGMGGSSGDGVRVGSGGTGGTGTSGVFDAPLAFVGGGEGTLSTADRAYLFSGLAARFNIVHS